MPLPWLILPLIAYLGTGAVAGLVFGALTLVDRARFGPPPRPAIVLPEVAVTEPPPDPERAGPALADTAVVPADADV